MRLPQRPRLVGDRVLQLDSRGGGRRRPLEDRERGIALATRLDQPSSARRDDLFDEFVVSCERHRHGAGVCLPGGGRSLDVGEQKGHGAGHRRKLLHHRCIQRCILRDDRGLEPAKLRPGIDSQLIGEQRPCPLISAKGFTLPAGAVEGEHQLAPSPFAQRRLGHRRLELADDLRGAARREQRVGPILDERGVALDPPRLLRCSPPAVGQFGDTAPEGKRLLEAGHRLAGVAGGSGIASQSRGRFIARGIDLALGERPTRALRQNKAVAQGATQRRDVGLQGLGGGAGRILAPEQLDEGVGRHDGTAVQPEHREDGAGFGARDRDGCPVLPDLQRSQNPQFHRMKRTHNGHRR